MWGNEPFRLCYNLFMKEYRDFREFYNKSLELTKLALSRTLNKKDAILYARKNFNKSDLKSYYKIGQLKKAQTKLINTKTTEINFSIDSLIKNILEHPDLSFDDYNKISVILKTADDIILGTYNHLRFFKIINEKLYEVIVKSTNDNHENFLLSLHRSDLSKLRNLKLKR